MSTDSRYDSDEKKQRMREAIEELKPIALEVDDRNKEMGREEAERIADEIVTETINRMIRQGKVKFSDQLVGRIPQLPATNHQPPIKEPLCR